MFHIDVMAREPVYEQIIDQMEQMVLAGLMKSGDQLPSVRNLSVELSINPNTIQKAYSELDSRGILQTVPGRGCFVAQTADGVIRQRKRDEMNGLRRQIGELRLAGVTRQEMIALIDSVYADVTMEIKEG